MFGSYHQLKTMANLEVLDFSEYYVATNLACIVSFVEDKSNITADTKYLKVVSSIRELYLDNMCGVHGSAKTHHVFKNISNLWLECSVPWNLKLLSFNGNRLTYFDVKFIGTYLTLETLLLAQNDMEYFNSEILNNCCQVKAFGFIR